jgi:FkbM family methyltransferase
MSLEFMKRLAARLPAAWQAELKRVRYRGQIRRQTFGNSEAEFAMLGSMLAPGDWVIDVGANVGHYTKRFSDLVGPTGRVIAFEPVPETFALLAANVALFEHQNVTLLNFAASNAPSAVGLQIPRFSSGLRNFYQAAVTRDAGDLQVLTVPLDSLGLSHRISLVKIDAEGHDAEVLQGMDGILRRDLPVLIVESGQASMADTLGKLGYLHETPPHSPNTLFRRPGGTAIPSPGA